MPTFLQISPEKHVEFPGGRQPNASVTLALKNVTDSPAAYKIKTTAPKNYLVRPSAGIIPPRGDQTVQIVLQQQVSAASGGSPDRFLVQAMEVESLTQQLGKDFWVNIPKGAAQDQRLTVVFGGEEGARQVSIDGGAAPLSAGSATGGAVAGTVVPPTFGSLSAGSRAPDTAGYEVRYNELAQYVMALEKDKAQLRRDLETTRQTLDHFRSSAPLCSRCGGSGSYVKPPGESFHFDLWQVIVIVIAFVLSLKVIGLL